MSIKVQRPILRYHGAKFAIAPWIISHFPVHQRYVEAYGGGASVLLRKRVSEFEVYNDLWSEVFSVFQVLRDPVLSSQLKNLLRLTPYAKEELELSRTPSNDVLEQARRTLVRSWFGHSTHAFANGLRTGLASSLEKNRIKEWLSWQEYLDVFTERLRTVYLENLPALEVIRKYDSESTLCYADPPYVHDTRNMTSGDGYALEMNTFDHVELSETLHSIKGMCVLSGYTCDLYNKLYGDWFCVTTKSACDGGERVEALWLNKVTSDRLSTKSLFDFF